MSETHARSGAGRPATMPPCPSREHAARSGKAAVFLASKSLQRSTQPAASNVHLVASSRLQQKARLIAGLRAAPVDSTSGPLHRTELRHALYVHCLVETTMSGRPDAESAVAIAHHGYTTLAVGCCARRSPSASGRMVQRWRNSFTLLANVIDRVLRLH